MHACKHGGMHTTHLTRQSLSWVQHVNRMILVIGAGPTKLRVVNQSQNCRVIPTDSTVLPSFPQPDGPEAASQAIKQQELSRIAG